MLWVVMLHLSVTIKAQWYAIRYGIIAIVGLWVDMMAFDPGANKAMTKTAVTPTGY
jgi:hypothetical protein